MCYHRQPLACASPWTNMLRYFGYGHQSRGLQSFLGVLQPHEHTHAAQGCCKQPKHRNTPLIQDEQIAESMAAMLPHPSLQQLYPTLLCASVIQAKDPLLVLRSHHPTVIFPPNQERFVNFHNFTLTAYDRNEIAALL